MSKLSRPSPIVLKENRNAIFSAKKREFIYIPSLSEMKAPKYDLEFFLRMHPELIEYKSQLLSASDFQLSEYDRFINTGEAHLRMKTIPPCIFLAWKSYINFDDNLDKLFSKVTVDQIMKFQGPYCDQLMTNFVVIMKRIGYDMGYGTDGALASWNCQISPYSTGGLNTFDPRPLGELILTMAQHAKKYPSLLLDFCNRIDSKYSKINYGTSILKSVLSHCGLPFMPRIFGGKGLPPNLIEQSRRAKTKVTLRESLTNIKEKTKRILDDRKDRLKEQSHSQITKMANKIYDKAREKHKDNKEQLLTETMIDIYVADKKYKYLLKLLLKGKDKPHNITNTLWRRAEYLFRSYSRDPKIMIQSDKISDSGKIKRQVNKNGSRSAALIEYQKKQLEQKLKRTSKTFKAESSLFSGFKLVPDNVNVHHTIGFDLFGRKKKEIIIKEQESIPILQQEIEEITPLKDSILTQCLDYLTSTTQKILKAFNSDKFPYISEVILLVVLIYTIFKIEGALLKTILVTTFLCRHELMNLARKSFTLLIEKLSSFITSSDTMRAESENSDFGLLYSIVAVVNDILGLKVDPLILKNAVNKCKNFNTIYSVTKNLSNFFQWLAEVIQETYNICLPYAYYNESPKTLTEREWMNETLKVLEKYGPGSIESIKTCDDALHVLTLYNSGLNMVNSPEEPSNWRKYRMPTIVDSLKSLCTHAATVLQSGKTRNQPLLIYMYGPPGCGKTTCTVPILNELYSVLHPGNGTLEPTQIYQLQMENTFHDSYNDQFATVIDDGFAIDDGKMAAELISELMKWCSTGAHNLKVADMTLFGKKWVSSEVIMLLHNESNLDGALVHDKNAYKRRRTVFVQVGLSEDTDGGYDVRKNTFTLRNTYTEEVITTMNYQQFVTYLRFIMTNRAFLMPTAENTETSEDLIIMSKRLTQVNELTNHVFTNIFKSCNRRNSTRIIPITNPVHINALYSINRNGETFVTIFFQIISKLMTGYANKANKMAELVNTHIGRNAFTFYSIMLEETGQSFEVKNLEDIMAEINHYIIYDEEFNSRLLVDACSAFFDLIIMVYVEGQNVPEIPEDEDHILLKRTEEGLTVEKYKITMSRYDILNARTLKEIIEMTKPKDLEIDYIMDDDGNWIYTDGPNEDRINLATIYINNTTTERETIPQPHLFAAFDIGLGMDPSRLYARFRENVQKMNEGIWNIFGFPNLGSQGMNKLDVLSAESQVTADKSIHQNLSLKSWVLYGTLTMSSIALLSAAAFGIKRVVDMLIPKEKDDVQTARYIATNVPKDISIAEQHAIFRNLIDTSQPIFKDGVLDLQNIKIIDHKREEFNVALFEKYGEAQAYSDGQQRKLGKKKMVNVGFIGNKQPQPEYVAEAAIDDVLHQVKNSYVKISGIGEIVEDKLATSHVAHGLLYTENILIINKHVMIALESFGPLGILVERTFKGKFYSIKVEKGQYSFFPHPNKDVDLCILTCTNRGVLKGAGIHAQLAEPSIWNTAILREDMYRLDVQQGTFIHLHRPRAVERQYVEYQGDHINPETSYELKGWQGDLISKPGDCGLPYVLRNHGQRPIVGIHAAGNGAKAMVQVLNQNLVLEMINTMTLKSECAIPKFIPDHLILVPHHGKGTSIPAKSQIRQSPIHGRITNPKLGIAHLSNFQKKDEATGQNVTISPMRLALSHIKYGVYDFNYEALDIVFQYFLEIYGDHITPLRKLSLETVINGEPGVYDSLELNTGAGYPFNTNVGKSKKVHYFEKFQEKYYPNEYLTNKLEECYNYENVVNTCCLKDETISLKKVESGETRLFSVAPLHFVLFGRQLTMHMQKQLQELRLTHPVSVGINVHSYEWQQFYENLLFKFRDMNQVGFLVGDKSKFDMTVPPIFNDMVCQFFQHFISDDECHPHYDPTFREDMSYFFSQINYSTHIVHSTSFMKYGGNVSGNPLTAVMNSISNAMMDTYIFVNLLLANKQDKKSILKTLHNDFAVRTYGDDDIIVVNKEKYPWFNQQTLYSEFQKIGIKYTDATKGKPLHPYCPVDEVSYLKRTFSNRAGFIYAPREETVVLETLNWIKDSDESKEEQTRLNAMAVMDDLVHLGEEVYYTN